MRTRFHFAVYFAALTCLTAFLAPAPFWSQARAQSRTGTPLPAARAASSTPVQRPSLATYLPSNALVYVEAENIPGALDEILKVESVKKFLASPDSGVPVDPTKYEQFLQLLGLPDKSVLAATRIGVSVTLTAPAPPSKTRKATSAPANPFPEPEIAVVAETPTESAAKQFVDSILRLFGQQSERKPVLSRIGRLQVTTIPGAKPKDSVAFVQDGAIILAGQPPVVRKLAARLIQPTSDNLAALPDYVLVRSQFTQPHNVLTYVNTKMLGSALRDLVAGFFIFKPTSSPPGAKPRPGGRRPRAGARTSSPTPAASSIPSTEVIAKLTELSGISSVGGIGFSAGAQNGQFYQQSVLNVDHMKPGLIPAFFDGPNVTMQAATFVPDSTQLFGVATTNVLRVFDTVAQMIAIAGTNGEKELLEAEAKLGFRIRNDFLAGFTGEFALALEGADFGAISKLSSGGVSPKVHVAGLAMLNNPQMVKAAVGKIFTLTLKKYQEDASVENSADAGVKKKSPPRLETYKGMEIILFDDDVSLAVIENALVIGRPDDVKRIIDGRGAGNTLARLATFRQMIESRPPDAISAFYASESLIKDVLDRAQNDIPLKYQPFLEGLTSTPLAFYGQRQPQSVSSQVSLPLPYLIGVFGGVYGASEAESKRRQNRYAAESALRDIFTAQQQYLNGPGGGSKYGGTLQAIAVGADGSKLFSEDILNMQSTAYNGYLLGPLRISSGSGSQPPRFSITAYPATRMGVERTGDDCLYIDETGELRRSGSPEKDADANSKAD